MNIKNNQFWFWGFIVLAALLISAVTTMGIRTYRFHNIYKESNMRPYNNQQNGINGQKRHRGQRGMRDSFRFTNNQRRFFRQERQQHQQKLRDIKSQKMINYNKLFNEISKDNSDNDSIDIYKTAILKLNKEIIEETINHYETLKTRLNKEQMKMVNNHVNRRLRRNNK